MNACECSTSTRPPAVDGVCPKCQLKRLGKAVSKVAPRRRRRWEDSLEAKRVDGYDCDDIGPSPD